MNDDRGVTALDPRGRTALDRPRGSIPVRSGTDDPCEKRIAPPPEQGDDERDGQRDGGDNERGVRILGRPEDVASAPSWLPYRESNRHLGRVRRAAEIRSQEEALSAGKRIVSCDPVSTGSGRVPIIFADGPTEPDH
jgi:hypothetical protein